MELNDEEIREIKESARLHFQNDDVQLLHSVEKLADAGWTWGDMRTLVSDIYRAGYLEAREVFLYGTE